MSHRRPWAAVAEHSRIAPRVRGLQRLQPPWWSQPGAGRARHRNRAATGAGCVATIRCHTTAVDAAELKRLASFWVEAHSWGTVCEDHNNVANGAADDPEDRYAVILFVRVPNKGAAEPAALSSSNLPIKLLICSGLP